MQSLNCLTLKCSILFAWSSEIYLQSPLIQRDRGISISLAYKLHTFSVQIPVAIISFNRYLWLICKTNHIKLTKYQITSKNTYLFLCPLQRKSIIHIMLRLLSIVLTLNVEGHTVSVSLGMVSCDACELLLVCLPRGNHHVVTAYCECSIRIPGFLVAGLAIQRRVPCDHTRGFSVGRQTSRHCHLQIGRASHNAWSRQTHLDHGASF